MTVLAHITGTFGRVTIMEIAEPVVPHVHMQPHIIIALEGQVQEFFVGQRVCELVQDQCVTVNPWQPHWYALTQQSGSMIAMVFYLDPGWIVMRSSEGSLPRRFQSSSARMTTKANLAVKLLVARMFGHIENYGPPFEYIVNDLYDEIMRCSNENEQSEPARELCSYRKPVDYRIRRSLDIMKDNIDKRLDFETVARQAGLSRPRYFQLFREQSGITPAMYWNAIRMNRAFKLLSNGNLPIGDVAFDLGFQSQSSFTRFFSSHFNCVPREFRAAAGAVRLNSLSRAIAES